MEGKLRIKYNYTNIYNLLMAIIPSWETKKEILPFWTTWMELEGISVLSRFSCVQLFVTCQAPLSMGFLQARILE